MSTPPARNRRIYQQIADQLCGWINAGEFPVGSYLPAERELSKRIGVSRTSVREALIAMEVYGLVKVRVGDGVQVIAAPSSGQLSEIEEAVLRPASLEDDPELGLDVHVNVEIPPFSLLEARRAIEPETAALAAVNATDEELQGIREAYERNVEDNRGGSTTHPGDRLFHIRIADASRNPVYSMVMRHLLGRKYSPMFQRLQALYTPQDMPHRAELEHRDIMDALQARDAVAAKDTMRKHLDSVIGIFSRADD